MAPTDGRPIASPAAPGRGGLRDVHGLDPGSGRAGVRPWTRSGRAGRDGRAARRRLPALLGLGVVPARWIALNESRGPVSAIDPARWWRAMTLRLAPVPCHGDRPQAVEVRQGMLVLARWTLPLAWASYTVTLRAPGRPVTLHYRCTVGVSAPGRGLRSARELAILLGGLEGTPGHSRPTIPVQRTH